MAIIPEMPDWLQKKRDEFGYQSTWHDHGYDEHAQAAFKDGFNHCHTEMAEQVKGLQQMVADKWTEIVAGKERERMLVEALTECSDYIDELLLLDEKFPGDWDEARAKVIKAHKVLEDPK